MDTFNKDLFRDRLKTLRKDKKLTQAEAAELFGVSRTCYSSWELGQSCPPLNDLFSLCEFFDVSADFLIGRSDNQKSHKSIPVSIRVSQIERSPLDGLLPPYRTEADNYILYLRHKQETELSEIKTEA